MTEPLANARAGGIFPPGATAGDLLGAARQASGLSIDAVAQQLKLAPRQVRALEEDDYTHLPGRTFVRGFIRSYARLVRLDPDEVLGALATGNATPALDAPTLQPTAPTMGELPTTEHSKAGWTRWAIPLILAAVVVAAAAYEWARPSSVAHPVAVTPDTPAATAVAPDKASTPLANPLAARAPGAEPSPPPAPAQTAAAVSPPATASAAESSTTPAPSTTSSTNPTIAAASSGAAGESIALMFKDYSWTEIRDRDGRVILSGMNRGGTSQSVSGTPPLEVVIGNASDVRVTYRGNPVDLAPHTRQNVARFKLP